MTRAGARLAKPFGAPAERTRPSLRSPRDEPTAQSCLLRRRADLGAIVRAIVARSAWLPVHRDGGPSAVRGMASSSAGATTATGFGRCGGGGHHGWPPVWSDIGVVMSVSGLMECGILVM